jgi:sugar lactone lactonase YvrE
MGFSPSLNKFYLVDSIPRNIYEYDYDIHTGDISNKKVLITLDRDDGLPDGMTVDAEGFIWVARWFGNGLSRYDPDGKLEREIEIPAAQVSSLTFGGNDYNEIFVTSAAVQWKTSLAPQHHNFSSHRGGGIYRIIQDIPGKPEYQARV